MVRRDGDFKSTPDFSEVSGWYQVTLDIVFCWVRGIRHVTQCHNRDSDSEFPWLSPILAEIRSSEI